MSSLKHSLIYSVGITCILVSSIATPVSAAFPAVDFGAQTVIAERYKGVVDRYDSKFKEYGISRSKRVELYEKRISQAYAALAKAKTSAVKKRYEVLIARYSKLLDTEIARIRKYSLQANGASAGIRAEGVRTATSN